MMIVGNKYDLKDSEEVDFEEVRNFALENRALYMRVSAMDNDQVKSIFEKIGEEVINRAESSGYEPTKLRITQTILQRNSKLMNVNNNVKNGRCC